MVSVRHNSVFFFALSVLLFLYQILYIRPTATVTPRANISTKAKHALKLESSAFWMEVYKSRKSIDRFCPDYHELEPAIENLNFTLSTAPFFPELAPLAQRRYFLAVLLHKSENSAPTLLFEIIKLLLLLRTSPHHCANIFVSILLTGFEDVTALELVGFQRHLLALGVEHKIEMVPPPEEWKQWNGQQSGGPWEHNKVLEPMFTSSDLFDDVIFFEDGVVVCASTVVQQISISLETDMSCSTDYHATSTGIFSLSKKYRIIGTDGNRLSSTPSHTGGGGESSPYHNTQTTQVFSCWGGVVIVKQFIFRTSRLRFRSSGPLECDDSHLQLFARDLWASNLHKIVLVRSAITAYTISDFQYVTTEFARHTTPTPQQPQPPPQQQQQPHHQQQHDLSNEIEYTTTPPQTVQCCPRTRGVELADSLPWCMPDHVWWWYKINRGVPLAQTQSSLTATFSKSNLYSVDVSSVVATVREFLLTNSQGQLNCNSKWGRKIPARIVQFWHTSQLTSLPSAVLLSMLSWIHKHPCFEYKLISFKALQDFSKDHVEHKMPEAFAALTKLHFLEQRLHFLSYLYMYTEGGFFAGPSTYVTRPVQGLIDDSDSMLVGLETNFWDGISHKHWVMPYAKTLGLDCWATEKNSAALRAVIERVTANIEAPKTMYTKVREFTTGSARILETMMKTGSEPFTSVLLQSFANDPSVHVLGLHEFHKYHQSSAFSESMTPLEHPRGIFVEIVNTNDWVVKEVAVGPTTSAELIGNGGQEWTRAGKLESPFELLPGVPLVNGDYLMSIPEATEIDAVWQNPVDQSVFGTMKVSSFLWLRSSSLRGASAGCLELFRGEGPDDLDQKLFWQTCWDKSKELGQLHLILREDRSLAVVTTPDFSCSAQDLSSQSNPSEPVVLWETPPTTSTRGLDVLFITQDGQLTVGRHDKKQPEIRSAMVSVLHSVRGYCHEMYSFKPTTVRNLEHALSLCLAETQCMSFTLKELKSGLKMFMCQVPMRTHPANSKRWITGTKIPGNDDTTAEKWVQIEGVQTMCAPENQLDRTGRDSVASLQEAEIMCSLDSQCASVIFKLDPTSQDDPELWLCKEHVTLDNGVFNPSYSASIRIWLGGTAQQPASLCWSVWHDSRECWSLMNSGLLWSLRKALLCSQSMSW